MDARQARKLVAKTDAMCKDNFTGSTAIISANLANEAQITFPPYILSIIHEQTAKHLKLVRKYVPDLANNLNDDELSFYCVLQQAVLSNDITQEDAETLSPDNMLKILKNLKLLPNRFEWTE